MSFIDKQINQAMKWENIEISVREMATLIQKAIIEKCSDNELIELEKGMRKGWVLGVGAPNRYYPSNYGDVKLRLKYSMLFHTIQDITLQDTVNKKEYFIPRGKSYCDKLRRTVLHRIALEEERRENTDVVTELKMPYNDHSRSRNTTRDQKSTPKLVYVLAVIGIIACLVFAWPILTKPIFNKSIPQGNTEQIATVQNGYLGEFTDMTVYDILWTFRIYYENEIWNCGTTNEGVKFVEVQFTSPDTDESATIQFEILDGEVFRVSSFQDSAMSGAQSSDVIYALTSAYYSQKCMDYLDQPAEIEKINTFLNEVDGSAILYGAASSYDGDRSNLYALFDKDKLYLSAAELLSIYGVDLVQAEEAVSEMPSETTISIETPTEITATPFNSAAGNALAAVMMGKNNFTMAETATHQSLFGMTEFTYFTFENYLIPTSFCVVDMDQDGTNEIIVGIDTDVDGLRLVLRYQDGTVYGYPFGFRSLKTVSTDGLVTGSSSAFESSITRLSFNSLTIDYYDLTDVEEQIALASWQDAAWYEFTEENVGKFFPNMAISFTLPSVPPSSTTVQQSETVETYSTGYVMYGTGGLNIRNGPGVGYDQIGRLPEGEQVVILETTYSGTAQWGRIERGWVSMDYIQMGTPAVSNVEAGSMYALDYINGTTGNVVNRIGDDYIMSGGFSGSYLFYYGNNPDMKFGFVPYDWTNPKINGTEPISVILLGGNARVNSYLSANMSKAEIDSVVWSMPNVQNVVSEQTYGAMWGNVYMYEIETTSARILYMWYLDNGDNINYPAGEVTISSK